MTDELIAAGLICNGLVNPLGISCEKPCFHWKIEGEGRGVIQKQFRFQLSVNQEFCPEGMIADITEDTRRQSLYLEEVLKEKTEYYWRVRLTVDCEDLNSCRKKQQLEWSETAKFETALKNDSSWMAKWIEAGESFYQDADALCKRFWKEDEVYQGDDQGLRRCPYLEKIVEVSADISYARLYVTARGLYEVHMNGKKIGDCAMAPDFTAYDKILYYQTYDITSTLEFGQNTLQVILGDGWFAGHAQGIPGTNHLYGRRPALLLQGEVHYQDGSTQMFISDESFAACTGPLLYADLFMGEYLDYREPVKKYSTVCRRYDKSVLVPQKGERIIEAGLLQAKSCRTLREGEYIVDFGRILAGRERILFEHEAGSRIKIEYSELLDENGDLMNLIPEFPYHDQTNYLCITNQERIIFEPKFSFQGFRYIKISGVHHGICKEQCNAVVLETGLKDTIAFKCSNPMVSRLVKNAQWSQRGNMISIPTDCPQRERGGFTGDAQVFCASACWNQNVEMFFRRWLEQCRLEQLERGQIPIVVPYTKAYSDVEANPGWTSAGWGDAIIFVPWDLYRAYGDILILKENYEAMERWMKYAKECAEETMPDRFYFDYENRSWQKFLWNSGYHWGDWLLPGYEDEEGVQFTKEITASVFYFREVCTMERICKELDMGDREAYYGQLGKKIKTAFNKVYVLGGKRLENEFQGAYVMALSFGIVEGKTAKMFAARLNEMVIQAKYHLQTGFLSTPFLLDTLCCYGFEDTALKVFYQESCPSWMYQVKQGATTIWENWDGDAILENGKVRASSFNHYAFGCVCDFIYRRIAGVSIEEAGFRKIRLNSEVDPDMTFAELQYETPYGKLMVEWNKKPVGREIKITVPHNTSAVVCSGGTETELGSGQHIFFTA